MKTEVINYNDAEAVRKAKREGRYVYVGYQSKWGNPYPLRNVLVTIADGVERQEQTRIGLERYETYLRSRPELMAELPSLRGKVLACFCVPLPCHADVLARLAEEIYERARQVPTESS
jgi:hypothetical protein